MKNSFYNKMKSLAIILATGLAGAFTSCSDDIIPENRYTFTGETIASHLEARPEYSRFCEVLSKAKIGSEGAGSLLKTLSTYGSYTCFAPNNEAIDKFLTEQYSIYKGELSEEEFIDSTSVEIAKNHIVERAYLTTDLKPGAFPQTTLNHRYMNVEFKQEEGADRFSTILNNTSRIVIPDIQCENGIVNAIDAVLSPSNEVIGDLVGLHSEFSIFTEALKKTAWDEKLTDYVLDPDYENQYAGKVSTKHPTYEGENFAELPYVSTKLQKYTIFVETDSLFKANGINNVDDLIEKVANKWYGSEYYDVVDYNDYSSPNNPLNRFVAYHILNCGMKPEHLVMSDNYENKSHGFKAEVHFQRSFDRSEYYETMLGKMVKVTLVGNRETNGEYKRKLLLNFAQDGGQKVVNKAIGDYLNIPVDSAQSATNKRSGLANYDGSALNGEINVIDGILIYNEDEMSSNVLNERIRINSASLFPELINNNIRWAEMPAEYSKKMGYAIPAGYIKNIKLNNVETKLMLTAPHSSKGSDWAAYQGDELIITCTFDFTVNLPPVPAGQYEIRFGFSASDLRGVVQFYFDDEITGIPVNMVSIRDENAGVWFNDKEFTADQIEIKDRANRNQGWMRGPESIILSKGEQITNMRQSSVCYRRIVTTATLNGTSNHTMRFKFVGPGSTEYSGAGRECSFDYLELVPKTVISDPNKPEDKN